MSDYWDGYYRRRHPELAEPSSFAIACSERLPESSSIFELGCGNGRDALYFARRGHAVTACDASTVAIDSLRRHVGTNGHPAPVPTFVHLSFEALDGHRPRSMDVVYARFTLHAVSRTVASRALAWTAANLDAGGRLFVEARSVLGSLYGQGEALGDDAFFLDGHYRRFIRRAELEAELLGLGFRVDEVVESDGLAPLGTDDPVVIRLYATRVPA
jgi:tellurite methyltransferase